MEQWKEEFGTHSLVPLVTIKVIDGRTKLNGRRVKTATAKLKIEQLKSKGAIFIINTESVGNKTLWPVIMDMGIKALVVDESHRFKGFNSVRTKALHQLADKTSLQYRYILTGSPILQDALDIWAQFYILDKNILGSNYYTFRNQYFYDANAGMPSDKHFPNWIPKDKKYFDRLIKSGVSEDVIQKQTIDNLNAIIYRHASRVMKSEVLDLPPYTPKNIYIEMPKEQQRMYAEMRDELVTTLDSTEKVEVELSKFGIDLDNDEVMSADLAIVKTLRLMQLTAGIFTNIDGEVTVIKTAIENECRDLLESICSNKENKAIVWSIFKPTYQIIAGICDKLGIKYVFLNGLQNKDEKEEAKKQFNTNPEIQVLIGNQAAGGTGVNLTAANYDIYYSWDFSLEKYVQSAARAYRGGQTRNYTSYRLVTPDTISQRSLDTLHKKADNAEDILKVRKIKRSDILGLI